MPFIYRYGIYPLWAFFKIFFPYKIKGRENLPKDGAYIIAGNHISYLDPLFFALTVWKRQIFFMGKAELFTHKFLAILITALGAFPVVRGTGGNDAISKAERILSEGKIIGIYPEGTRSKTGELGRAKTGVAVIAKASNVPVVPVAIVCKNQKSRVFRHYTIVVLPKIDPQDINISDFSSKRASVDLIMKKIGDAIENEKSGKK